MRINAVRYENGELILATTAPEAIRFAYKFKAGEYDIKQTRKKRSLDANAMAWALINDIAAVVRIPPNEVYRQAVMNVGGASEVICIQKEAKDSFVRLWTAGHIGRQVQELPSKIDGCITLVCTYGSSDYDVQQMSQLIDSLLQDCENLGIETPEQRKINSLLEEWSDR